MEKVELSWKYIFDRLQEIDKSDAIVYGVPKGGMILCAFLRNAKVTEDPGKATIIIDDIVDSGTTMQKYKKEYKDISFWAVINKLTEKEFKDKWIVFPWEKDHPNKEDSIQENIVRQLQYIGEDVNREGLVDTPNRIVRMYDEIFSGYKTDISNLFTVFDKDTYDQFILLKNCEMFSMCEHHMMPFFGKIHIAYIPNKKVVGISKLARLADYYCKRLQIQERIGEQVTSALMKYLDALGAACIIEASHLCMRMRGVSKQNSIMLTSSLKGVFLTKMSARQELLNLIKG